MPYKAKSRTVNVNGVSMSYVEFGYGQKPLVMVPGLGDGLTTVKGKALNLAYFYRRFAKDFKVYVFSRKDILETGYTTGDMAKDLKAALDTLGIGTIFLMGVSQGGMIAQRFAIEYPSMVEKLVLVVSASRPNDTIRGAVGQWIDWVRQGDFKAVMIDTLEKSYSPKKLKTYRPLYPLLVRISKPKDPGRFIIQANACLTHDAYDELDKISCPTLIIGGDNDKIVGTEASPEMAGKIKNSVLHIYEGLGHAAYEEAKDFNDRVIQFL